MKVANGRVLAIAVLVFSLACRPIQGQETQTAPKSSTTDDFVKLDEGVRVLRLFQVEHSRGGEVAILRLSNDNYTKFNADPTKFVNETYANKIFLFQVKDVKQVGSPLSGKLDKAVVVVLAHDPGCHVQFIVEPLP